LDDWAEKNNKRAMGQAGFRKDRSTVDNIFVLQHIIERSHILNQPLYTAFIDFRKAYDSVHRDILWKAISGMGVHGFMLDTLKHMYSNICMQVRLQGRLGDPFTADMGVKQGDPLSPLLFGLFIDRFESFVHSTCPDIGINLDIAVLIKILLFADDLVLTANSCEQLQKLVDALQVFCEGNLLTVNISKSVVVPFNTDMVGSITFKGAPLPKQVDFCYLGIRFQNYTINPLHDVLNRNLSKARAACFAMQQRCREMGMSNIAVRCNLFNTLVTPVINYGCEVWGVYQLAKIRYKTKGWGSNGVQEDLHKAFLRQCLMVPKSTTLGPMMHETNRIPIMHGWCKQVLGWWNKIVARPDNDIVKLALRDSITLATSGLLPRRPQSSKCWASAILACLKAIDPNLENNIVALQHINIPVVMKSLYDLWQHFLWRETHIIPDKVDRIPVRNITDSSGFKKRTYQYWFSDSAIAKGEGFIYYLNSERQIRAMARYRLGSHNLAVNQQRYTHKLDPESSVTTAFVSVVSKVLLKMNYMCLNVLSFMIYVLTFLTLSAQYLTMT
jgi:hypothetical protein